MQTNWACVKSSKQPENRDDFYAGNSLLEKNILFCIKSDRSFGNEIEAASQTDSFNYKVLKIKDIEEIESISEENSVFEYPQIDESKCVRCYQCIKVCPIKAMG